VALPFLWTTRVKLVDAGNSIVLPIQSSDAAYYLPGNSAATSIYMPDSAGVAAQGRGTLRIRQVLDTKGGITIVEGTFTTQ
jgi:hypothetical protein